MKRKALWMSVALPAGLLAFFFLAAAPLADTVLNRRGKEQGKIASAPARALYRTLQVADLHADSLLWGRDLLLRARRGHVDVPRLIEANVALQAFTVVTKTPRFLSIEKNEDDADNVALLAAAQRWPKEAQASLLERALYQARRLRDAAASSGGRLVLVTSGAELTAFLAERARDPRRVAALLGLEGAQALEGKIENLEKLQQAGYRMIAPTHFTDTEVAGSAHGAHKGGLSKLGEQWLKEMEARHLLIDLAHASPQTIDDVLARATRPVLVSHTGVKGTCDNQRNLSDAQLRAIAKTGGVVGIAYFPTAVCGDDAAAIARAIVYTVKVIGPAHVGLGSDFDGAVGTPFDTNGLPLIVEALLAQGMPEAQIRQVMGENTLRVLGSALP